MTKIKGITDVFFDLDHTLWDFDRNSALTFEKIFKINNITVNLKAFLNHYEPINLNYWKLYREEKIDKTSLRYGRLNDAFRAIDYKVSDDIINRLSEDYIEHLSTFNNLFEDTVVILKYLFDKYTLHIITNGFSEVQQGKLNNSNIGHFFHTVTNSEQVGVKKPNPMIFHHALTKAKAEASRSVMIGDNYEADILGATNVGMSAIYFNNEKTILQEGIHQIHKLLQLKDYL